MLKRGQYKDRENMKLNKIPEGIQYHQEDVLCWNNLNHDIILANINRNVIEKLIPKLHNSKSIIILSGLLETDYQAIEKLCNKHKLQVNNKIIKGEWICIEILPD